jgi:ABC-2 type transport system permease protein
VSATLRLRAEETEGRADPVLAGAVGRVRWGLSHVVVAVAGTASLLAIAGVAAGLGYGLRAGGTGFWVSHMVGAGLAELPAALVIAGVATAVFGLLPQVSAAVSWTAVGLAVALNIFGQVVQLSHWWLDISPFTHVPRLPGGTVSASPLFWLSVIAVALGGTGLAALRRRDISSALSRSPGRVRANIPSSAWRERYVETRTAPHATVKLSVLLLVDAVLLRHDTPMWPFR